MIEHIFPPIPIRSFDYLAYRESYDLGALTGSGPTALAAIADLFDKESDDCPCECFVRAHTA